MSYIGNEPIVSATRTITEIIATAGQTVFNVNGGYTVGFLDVFINGAQLQTSDFTASNGTTVTLSSPAVLNDDVRLVAWGTFNVANAAPVADPVFSGSSLKLPVVTTAGRPASPQFGMVLANSTTGDPEWWDATTSTWKKFAQPSGYLVEYLVVAGGGSGGSTNYAWVSAGGGGAGGVATGTSVLSAGATYPIVIGAGGAAVLGNSTGVNGLNGSNSSFNSISAIGGGAGGGGATSPGFAGGSGGGAGRNATGGSGTTGQGYKGGDSTHTDPYSGGAGGGGAGAAGGNGPAALGGIGVANAISGTSTYYGGGGSGAMNYATPALGGGGKGGGASGAATSGAANTGGGGGGYFWADGAGGTPGYSGGGGSGIVILRYLGSQRGTGGTVTSSGGYTIHTFTSSGTYVA